MIYTQKSLISYECKAKFLLNICNWPFMHFQGLKQKMNEPKKGLKKSGTIKWIQRG